METEVEPTTLPPLFRRHARRPRLTRLIDESKAQSVILMGPPGYGKTVLAREWAQGRDKIVWYRATSGSADVAAFSVGIADVVAPLVPGAGDRLRQRIRVGDPPEKAARPYAELLSQDLASWPSHARLIVDDYHLVTESAPVEEFVDWLLTLTPSLRLIVTTRHRPAWVSAKRILHGEVTEIEKDQLAMTNEEAGRVLAGRTTETVRDLVRRAEGWPVLIGLAALAASSELPTDRISDALFRYFAEEVLRQEPPDVQEFMLLASIPATVSQDVAEAVLDVADPAPILNRLVSAGLLDPTESGSLAFHPLVREFLRTRLSHERPGLVADLISRAIQYSQVVARWEEAFDLAASADRVDACAEILEQSAAALFEDGRVETLETWLMMCGPVADRPACALVRAELLVRRGALSTAAAVAHDVVNRLARDDPRECQAWCLVGQARHLLGHYEDALSSFLTARDGSQTDDQLKRSLWGAFVSANQLELADSEVYLETLQSLSSQDLSDRIRLAVGRLQVAERRCTYEGIWDIFAPLVPLAPYARDPMASSAFLVNAAFLNVARAQYGLATAFADDAFRYCERLGLRFAVGFCLSLKAQAAIGLRNFSKARHALKQLATFITSQEDPHLHLDYRVCELKLRLAEHGPRAFAEWSPDLSASDASAMARADYTSLIALGMAASGRSEEALAHVEDARTLSSCPQVRYYTAFSDLILQLSDGEVRSPRDYDALISEVSRADFLDSLVVSYRACPQVILTTDAVSPHTLAIFKRAFLLANDSTIGRQAGFPALREAGSPSRNLTKREREVLELIAHGLSNQQIASRLFIAPSTTKIHVRHILRKLGVNTRLEAALLAREAGHPDGAQP